MTEPSFIGKLRTAWEKTNSLLCVGLDPDLEKLPACVREAEYPIFEFNRQIIDQTAQFCCCYKPQIAYYSAYSAELELEKTIAYIKDNHPYHPVILDAKRGDIGDTARMYAREAFLRYDADAVTVNPYMGGDTLQPFLDYADKGVVVLCRTSNAGSAEFQALNCEGYSLAHQVARQSLKWNKNDNIMLVTGATYPREIGEIRAIVGDMPLLVPGVGAQGGELRAVLENGLLEDNTGLMINSSRGIIYASGGDDFAFAAGEVAHLLSAEINAIRSSL
jgi:orotidine-5'-phosphate decarboxylase